MPDASATGTSRLRAILMGTGPFAVPAFEAVAAEHEVVLVVTRPARATKSRHGAIVHPVTAWATARGLPVEAPASINDESTVARLRSLEADLAIVCDYGQILKADALSATRLGAINLHGSLLPRHRGAAPVQWTILSGDEQTGVSVIQMTPGLDAGPVLAREQTMVRADETAGELEARLADLGPRAVLRAVEILRSWDGKSRLGETQDPAQVTRAPRFDKTAGQLDCNQSATEAARRIRALQPWPGSFMDVPLLNRPAVRVQILRASAAPAGPDHPDPGVVLDKADKAPLRIACREGVLLVHRLQPAGKRPQSAEEFARGYPFQVGGSIR